MMKGARRDYRLQSSAKSEAKGNWGVPASITVESDSAARASSKRLCMTGEKQINDYF